MDFAKEMALNRAERKGGLLKIDIGISKEKVYDT